MNRSRVLRHPSWKRALGALEWVLLGLAFAAAVYLGYVALDGVLYDARGAKEMRKISLASADSSVAPAAIGPAALSALPTSVPLNLRERPAPGALIGRLEIPGVGVESLVAAGTDTLTLRRGVGHVNGTALPGEPGNIGLAGHRDTVFRGLRNLQTSDHIFLRTAEGSFEYSIESFRTVTPDQVEVLESSPYPTLTLITCYPFDFIGPAPMRFIVRARQVATPLEDG